MTKGFYMYLTMLVLLAFLLGFQLKARIDGDTSLGLFEIFMCFVYCVGAFYLVVDEYKLKEDYKNVQ